MAPLRQLRRERSSLKNVIGTHNKVAEVALPSETAAGAAELSGAASTVEEREKLAQAHVTGLHNGVTEVVLPSVT